MKKIADLLGISYKVSGAGGGDMGLAFSLDVGLLEEFKRQVNKDYSVLDLDIDTNGLTVEMVE